MSIFHYKSVVNLFLRCEENPEDKLIIITVLLIHQSDSSKCMQRIKFKLEILSFLRIIILVRKESCISSKLPLIGKLIKFIVIINN